MNSHTQLFSIVFSVILLVSVLGTAITAAQDTDEGLTIETTETADEYLLTVTDANGSVANASVNVTVADMNQTYDGAGDYETDANGTVGLPGPEQPVNVTVTATADNQSASETVMLEPLEVGLAMTVDQADDGSATVTVTDNGTAAENASVNISVPDENVSYAGAGTYTTSENGTADLPAPNQTVTVSVTVMHDNQSLSESVTLQSADDLEDDPDDATPFGQEVKAFVHSLLNETADDNTTIGHQVAEFVTSNNPGNAPDHAGPKSTPGKPAHAGPDGAGPSDFDSDDATGPPAHAGPDAGANGDNESTSDVDAEDGHGPGNGVGGPPGDRDNR